MALITKLRPRLTRGLLPNFVHVTRLLSTRREFVPSADQIAIVEACKTKNVVVSAVPGAGKTATSEALAQANPGVPIAVVTYSKRLQLDTAHRLGQYSSCHAYTFHGLAGNLFGTLVNTDDVLRELRASSAVPICPPPLPYEYLVLDELQDMTPDLYWLTMNIISALARSSGRAPRILILGDSFQAMHQFRGADARYLDLAPDIFSSVSPYPWAEMSLSKSFRLSQETASFLNHGFLGGKQIIEGMNRGGEKPQYVRFDPSDYVKGLAELCLPVFKRYGCENSAILAPSVRRNWLLSAFTNALSKEHRLPVAVSIGDDVELREQVIRGKIVVSTIHQFKGSQRDFVIVFGADAGYFKFFGRDLPDDRCPNTIYVALTRAREQLMVLQSTSQAPMPFVNNEAIARYGALRDISEGPVTQKKQAGGRPSLHGLRLPKKVALSEASRHVRKEDLHALVNQYLRITERNASHPEIEVPDIVCTDRRHGFHEAVSDLNGLVVAAAFEWQSARTLRTLGHSDSATPPVPETFYERVVWLTRQAAQYEAKLSGYYSRLVQMRRHPYDWLTRGLPRATDRLQNELKANGAFVPGTELRFEILMNRPMELPGPEDVEARSTVLSGQPDLVHLTEGGGRSLATVYEIKFVSVLGLQHAVQAASYAFLWVMLNGGINAPFPRIVLFNVRDGTRWDIETTLDEARQLIEGVLRSKYTSKAGISDEEFLQQCERARAEIHDA